MVRRSQRRSCTGAGGGQVSNHRAASRARTTTRISQTTRAIARADSKATHHAFDYRDEVWMAWTGRASGRGRSPKVSPKVLQDRRVDMHQAAQAYCSCFAPCAGAVPGGDQSAFASHLLTALGEVVAAAMRLPEVGAGEEVDFPVEVSHEQWHAMYQRIGRLLPWAGYYWEVSYPFDDDEVSAGAVVGDLVDDLADVWRDLQNGLLALGEGVPPGDVQAQWRRDYWSHWAHHALSAMRMLTLHLSERGRRPPRQG